jgi:hypothetical protein
MTTLLILVQEYEKSILEDLIPVSPMNMTQVWIELLVPDEVGPPISGTEGSLPASC